MNAIPTELSCGHVHVTHTISGFEIMQHLYKPFEQWWLLYAIHLEQCCSQAQTKCLIT